MSKQAHRALIEKVAEIIDPTLFNADANALLDKWAGNEHDSDAAWRAEMRHGMNIGVRRNLARGQATAALAVVNEALREPSDEMLRAGYNADISPPEATYFAMLSASALSVSPLQGEETPVDCGDSGDKTT